MENKKMTNKEIYLNDVKDSVRYVLKLLTEYEVPRYTDFTVIDWNKLGMLRRYRDETIDAINEVLYEEGNIHELGYRGWWFSKYSKQHIYIY